MTSKVWIITGAGRGLGRAITQAALTAGERVVATARDTGSLAELVAAHPGDLLTLTLDVRDEAQVQAVMAEAMRTFGHIDVAVNNAGYANLASIEDVTSVKPASADSA